jgi:phospholipase/carboxylesterase
MDPVVMPSLGEDTRGLLEQLGYDVDWHSYPVAHGVCPEEVADIRLWLKRVLLRA